MRGVDYGSDGEYAETRLKGSMVLWKKPNTNELHPVFIKGILSYSKDSEFMGSVYGLDTTVNLSDLYNLPVKLGFCNCMGASSYLARVPHRKWKQGVRRCNLMSLNKSNIPEVWHDCFISTVKGNYPNVMSCLDRLTQKEVNSIAFSREFCLKLSPNGNDIALVLDKFGRNVAKLEYDNHHFQLNIKPNFLYFKETIEENLK